MGTPSLSGTSGNRAALRFHGARQIVRRNNQLAPAHAGADRNSIPQIGCLLQVKRVRLPDADRGHAAANVARQAEDLFYRDEFHLLVSADRSQSLPKQEWNNTRK